MRIVFRLFALGLAVHWATVTPEASEGGRERRARPDGGQRPHVLPGSTQAVPKPAVRGAPFDHSLFQQFLDRYTRGGTADFSGVQKDPSLLDRYLAEVGRLPPERFETFSREGKMAFLINVLNALTVKFLAERYPLKDVRSVLEKNGEKFVVMGRTVTREEVERDLLRKRFRDERVHAALYRGSKTGPPLRTEVYRGETLDRFLDEDARNFVNDATQNAIRSGKRKIYLSPIFKEYAEDFILNYGGSQNFRNFNSRETAILSFVADYIDPGKKDYLERGRFKIKYRPYDGTLRTWGGNSPAVKGEQPLRA